MAKIWLILIIAIVVTIIGAGIYLMTADIPAPTQTIEKTLPDDAFPN